MKKRFSYLMTLLCLLLCGASNSWAGDVYIIYLDDNTVTLNGTKVTSDLFTVAGSKHTKYKDGTWNGHTFSTGLKLDSSGKVTFTTSTTSTITVVQSLSSNGTNRIKFGLSGGTTLANNDNRVDSDDDKVGVHTFTDQAPGDYTVAKGNSETGILAIKIEYTGAVMTKLDAPTISYEAASGEVTITGGTNVKYTTDGTNPSESNGTVYADPFIVEDGTTVKAASIGDQSSTINSDIASELVLLTGITLSTPTISCVNGTVGISCSNPYVTIKYTLDGGAEQTYAYPFTLSKDANIAVTVSRDGCTSANANADVTAVPAAVKTKTVYFGFGSGDVTAAKDSGDGYSTLIGKAGDEAEGYSLTLLNEAKEWTSGQHRITYNGVTKTAIKLSNGAQNRINLPDGVKATKLTLISFVNSDPVSGVSGWKEINGEDMDYSTIPMGCSSANEKIDEKTYITNTPDVRVYPLDNVEGSITFNNGGTQLCFMLAIDVIEPTQKATISAGGYTTFCPVAYDVTIPDGVTAYTAAMNDAKDAVVLTEVAGGKLPKGCGVVLGGTAGETYKFEPTTDAAALAAENLMTGATADIDDLKNVYVLGVKDGSCLFGTWSGTTFPAGKAYLNYSPSLVGAPSIGIVFNDEATAISALANEQTKNVQGYNLAGQKVGNNFRGIVIVNGKKTIIK